MRKKLQLNDYGLTLGGLNKFLLENGTDPEDIENKKKRAVRMLNEIIQNELTDRQQLVVNMYFFDKKQMQEIAAVLGVNKSTVSRIMKRALERIKIRMQYAIQLMR